MVNEDSIIVEACQKGNLKEFGKLYDKYIKKIYDFIYYKTFHKETAEDLTSIVFTKALESINKFESTGTFSSWIYRIARNTVIDYYRTKKIDSNIDDVWDLASDEDVQGDIDAKEQLEKVKECLRKLKSEQRDIIIMRVWQEMSYFEIARAVGKSEANCKMIFSRAIRQLRAEMPLGIFVSFLLKVLS